MRMVIELFGLPGAGKTTLAHALTEVLDLPVVRLPLWKRLFYWKYFFLVHPREAIKSLENFFHYVLENRRSLFLNGCIDRYARFQKAQTSGGILDEGPLQNTLSYPSRVLFPKEMEDIVATLPHPDVVIHVTAPKDIRLLRQKDRGRIAREELWETYATENESLALAALPPTVTVLEYPAVSLSEIASRIQSL